MSDRPDISKFQKKLAERRAAEEAKKREAQKTQYVHDEDLIPDNEDIRTEQQQEIDKAVDGIDILDAYRVFCGKMEPKRRGDQREGIKISCPIPGHVDKDPSAWINLDKQTWYCGGCAEGGDSHDLAAYHFGYDVPGYKKDGSFHKLREQMAESFGVVVTSLPGGGAIVSGPEPTTGDEGSSDDPPAEVIELYDNEDEEILLPTLNWRPIIPPDTFIDTYMTQAMIDDVPEEYHLFHALLALGFALGREVRLYDFVPVFGNLFVCTLGRSGSGKSKARFHLDTLLTRALPHDWNDPNSKGVRKISAPGSAEVLIHNFQKAVADPTNPKNIAYYAPVRGLVDFNELSSLIHRAKRQGSVIAPTMMSFYDMEPLIATSSMTHGQKEAHEPFASALTTTQPRALRNLIDKSDDASGFLNRWVFVPGGDKQRFAIGGVRVNMEPAVEPLQSIHGWAGSFKSDELINWTPEAAKLFTQFFHERIEPEKKKAQTALLTRTDLLMKKLILLFTANLKQRLVPAEAVESSIKMFPYLLESYGVPAEELGTSLSSEVAEAVLYQTKRVWERDKKGVTLNQVAKALKHRKYPNDLLIKTIDNLVKLGFLRLEASPKGSVGRPTTRYKYVE